VAGAAAGGWVAAGAGAAVAAGWQAVKNMLAKINIVTTTYTKRCFTFSSFKEYVILPKLGNTTKRARLLFSARPPPLYNGPFIYINNHYK
jgi:hypothetical protein